MTFKFEFRLGSSASERAFEAVCVPLFSMFTERPERRRPVEREKRSESGFGFESERAGRECVTEASGRKNVKKKQKTVGKKKTCSSSVNFNFFNIFTEPLSEDTPPRSSRSSGSAPSSRSSRSSRHTRGGRALARGSKTGSLPRTTRRSPKATTRRAGAQRTTFSAAAAAAAAAGARLCRPRGTSGPLACPSLQLGAGEGVGAAGGSSLAAASLRLAAAAAAEEEEEEEEDWRSSASVLGRLLPERTPRPRSRSSRSGRRRPGSSACWGGRARGKCSTTPGSTTSRSTMMMSPSRPSSPTRTVLGAFSFYFSVETG